MGQCLPDDCNEAVGRYNGLSSDGFGDRLVNIGVIIGLLFVGVGCGQLSRKARRKRRLGFGQPMKFIPTRLAPAPYLETYDTAWFH